MIKTSMTVAAILAALFSNSEKAISEKLTQEEFNAFAGDAQEVQNRLDAQAQGNAAMNGDLTTAKEDADKAEAALKVAQTERDTAQTALATANQTIATLQAKADQWDAYKASLTATVVADDSTNTHGKAKADTGLTAKDQKHLDRLAELKEKYPTLMADIDVPAQA